MTSNAQAHADDANVPSFLSFLPSSFGSSFIVNQFSCWTYGATALARKA